MLLRHFDNGSDRGLVPVEEDVHPHQPNNTEDDRAKHEPCADQPDDYGRDPDSATPTRNRGMDACLLSTVLSKPGMMMTLPAVIRTIHMERAYERRCLPASDRRRYSGRFRM